MKVNRFPTLDDARAYYARAVDAAAGRIRGRHLTDVTGQTMTYEFKRQDAVAFQNAGEPNEPDNYPWVAAEADAMGDTMSAAATEIVGRANAWWDAGVAIERERMQAKYAVRNAATPRAMKEATDTAEAAMQAISDAIP